MEYNLENLMATAISEMENGQHEEAAKHFDLIVINDGSNYKAAFYRTYCKCFIGKLGDIPNQAINLTNAFSLLLQKVQNVDEKERESCIKDALTKISKVSEHFSHNAQRTMFTAPTVGMNINKASKEMYNNCIALAKKYNVILDVETQNKLTNAANKSNNSGKALLFIIIIGAIISILSYLFIYI